MKYYKKVFVIGIVIFIGTAYLFAQPPDTLWTETYGESDYDDARSVQQTIDGGYIIAGYTLISSPSNYNVYLIKTDANGDTLWTNTYGGDNLDHGYSVQQTTDGGYIITGRTASFGAGSYDVYLIKTDANGDTLWTKTYGGESSDAGWSVQQTSDGGYIIAGYMHISGSYDVYLIKTDAHGDTLWTKTYGGEDPNMGYSVQQTTDGGYIIAGKTGSMEDYSDSLLVWNHGGRDPYQSHPVRQISSEKHKIKGKTGSLNRLYDDVYLIKTDANGDTLWTRTYEGPGGANAVDRGWSVQQTTDGGYIIGGETGLAGAGAQDFYLIKTDANGDTLWTKTYGGTLDDRAYSVQQTTDNGYIITGKTGMYITSLVQDVYIVRTDADGNTLWTKTYGVAGDHRDYGFSVQQTMDEGYVIVGFTGSPFNTDVYFIRLTPDSLLTDDPLSLAYNGNRHFVRQPNSEILHLVYVMEGHVIYTRSSDGGTSWDELINLGPGESPAICLDRNGNPCVTWAHADKLSFSKKDPVQGWICTNYSFGASQPFHPCITVTPSHIDPLPDTGHILVRLFNDVFSHNSITEVSFPVTDPQSYQTRTLEASSGANMITLDFPSIARDFNNTMHAAWMHADTVYYGTRPEGQNWNIIQNPFDPEGRNSAHPFAETYGDSIFVVWQNETDEEIYRGRRHLQEPNFYWANLSQTSTTPSIYPVNASGMVTTFVDKSSALSEYDIFWKTAPGAPLHNLSNTPHTKSLFPHTSLKVTEEPPTQYTVWQEGNDVPYEIKFERASTGRESPSVSAYFNSIAGFETPSLYLVERDTFISDWQIPVDMGDNTMKYELPLEPGYTYKAKFIAYHEAQGPWQAGVRLDGGVNWVIQYNAFQPETLEVLVPPALYQDSLLEVEFELVSGGLAMGPVHIYRYEDEPGGRYSGGPQSAGTAPLSGLTINHCTMFKGDVRIDFALPFDQKTKLYLYDITGRLLRKMHVSKRVSLTENNLSSGVYFLRIDNPVTGKHICWKFVKIK